MQDFTKLDVWKKSHELAVQLFLVTAQPAQRTFPGLIAQMRRSASSIPANIAEGCGHSSQRELARFLQHAIASSQELQYHLILAHDLELLSPASCARLEARTSQVRQMLSALLRRVRTQPKPLPQRTVDAQRRSG